MKRLVVALVSIALVGVLVGGGVFLLSKPGTVTPPVIPPVTAAPTVTSTSPANAATGVSMNTKVTATFSKAMDPSTITAATFTLKHGTTVVPGTLTYAGLTASFTPTGALLALTAHSVTITTGAKDTTGRALASNFVWNFTTTRTPDTTAPLVSFTSPSAGALGAPINTKILATFSEAMDPATITASTFILKHGTTSVSGTVTYAGTTATFVPSGNLAASTLHSASITIGAKDLAGNPLRATFVWNFTSGLTPDTTPPRVSSTSPVANVAINSNITATFSEVIDPSTVSSSTFTVKQGTTSVSGAVSYAGLTATFNPPGAFTAGTAYTATITTGVKDLAGNAMLRNFVWTFTTASAGQAADTTPPTVSFTSPASSATGTPMNAKVLATFSEAMDPSTVTVASFLLTQGATSVSGLVSYSGLTATFSPSADFAASTMYTATLNIQAKDLAGNALAANYAWTFTTGAAPDTTPPRVISTGPAADAVAVSSDTLVTATLSEAMDPSTVSVSTFVLAQGSASVSGLVSYDGLTATFHPDAALAPNTTYTATVNTGARDLAGNALALDFVWNFTTADVASACGQLGVNLGSAVGFAIVAGSTVTNTGGSTITGDLGLSPGSEVTGFPPGTLVGTQHVADTAAASAMGDLTIAYNDAQGRTLCPVSVAGNLGGMTLAPGLYKSTSGLEITSGDLTLDAHGDPNAVFIFQMASTLVTTVGLKVILAGGAQASHIFWAVGTSATFGVNSTFVGTVMADQSISFDTGAVLEGRALARIGAVTLDATTITKPAA